MKSLGVLIMLILLGGCQSATTSDLKDSDSLGGRTVREFKDSIINNMEKKAASDELASDTAGMHTAPVRVTSARLVKQEYSNFRDIALTYKNYSGKKVTAIRFEWYGLNAFGEPADMGGVLTKGYGGGFTDDHLSPGGSDDGTWSILSRDGKKVVAAWATEVVFSDGSKWKNK